MDGMRMRWDSLTLEPNEVRMTLKTRKTETARSTCRAHRCSLRVSVFVTLFLLM